MESITLAALVSMAEAQWTPVQPQQSRQPAGNTTYYYNANGSSAGTATRMGGTTYYSNPNGSSAGTATSPWR